MKNITRLIIILLFLISCSSQSYARKYHFVSSLPGLIDSPKNGPFVPETTFTSNVSILDISDIEVLNEEQVMVDVNLTTANGTDLNGVTLSYSLSDSGIIENTALIGTGASRKFIFNKDVAAESGSSTTVEIRLSANGVKEDKEQFEIIVSDLTLFSCNASNPLENFDREFEGAPYLIGGTSGDSELAKSQLLCLSQNQTFEVLSADYELTTDVTFDINFTTTKMYQNKDGNENLVKDSLYKYLKSMNTSVSSNEEDWDGDGNIDETDTAGWIPIGNTSSFTGSFEGNGHKINNLYINRPTGNNQGLFGNVNGAVIENLGLENTYVLGLNKIGSFFGYANGSTVKNSYSKGIVLSNVSENVNDTGGIIGDMENGSVVNSCYFEGDVLGRLYAGSIVGKISNGSIVYNSYSKGLVSGFSFIGGIAGLANGNVSIVNSYSEAYAYGNSNVGGVVGVIQHNTNTSIKSSYSVEQALPGGAFNVGSTLGAILNGVSPSSSVMSNDGTYVLNGYDSCEYIGVNTPCLSSDIYKIQEGQISLESDGINDAIDTGLTWSPNVKVHIKGAITGTPDTYDKMTGTVEGGYMWIGIRNGKFYFGTGGNGISQLGDFDKIYHDFIIDLPNNISYIDNTSVLCTGSPKPNGRKIFLYAREKEGASFQHTPMKISGAKIWKDGTLVRDLVPQINGTFKDIINNTIYSNIGSGSFVVESCPSWDSSDWSGLGTVTPSLKNMPN